MSHELGSGPQLDEHFDLKLDQTTGGITVAEGIDELEKDVAFNVTRLLDGDVSGPISDGQLVDIEEAVQRVIVIDERVSTATASAQLSHATGETVVVNIEVESVTGETFSDVVRV